MSILREINQSGNLDNVLTCSVGQSTILLKITISINIFSSRARKNVQSFVYIDINSSFLRSDNFVCCHHHGFTTNLNKFCVHYDSLPSIFMLNKCCDDRNVIFYLNYAKQSTDACLISTGNI